MFLLDDLFTSCKISVLNGLNFFVVFKIKLCNSMLKIRQLDLVFHVKLIHHSRSFKHEHTLSLLLRCNTLGVLNLPLCFKFHFGSLNHNLLCLLLGQIVTLWLSTSSYILLILLHLLKKFRISHGLLDRSLKVSFVELYVLSCDFSGLNLDLLILNGCFLHCLTVLLHFLGLQETKTLLHHLLLARDKSEIGVLSNDRLQLNESLWL